MTTKTIAVTGHAALLPVLKDLVNSEHAEYEFVTPHPEFERQMGNLDWPVIQFSDLLRSQSYTAYNNAAQLFSKTLALPDTDTLSEPVHEFWRNGLAGHLYPRAGEMAMVIQGLVKADPSLIIIHNDVEFIPRIMALWGKAHYVPVLHVPHSVYLPHADRGAIGEDIHDWIVADYVAVAGPSQAEWFKKRGVKCLNNTGLPQFDKWSKPTMMEPVHARKLLELDPARPVITYASSWRQDTNLLGGHDGVVEAYQAFLDMINLPGMNRAQYIIKCHPNNPGLEQHMALAEKAKVDCTVTAQHLNTVLQASDMVITYGPSNVLLESTFFPNLRTAMLVETAYQYATDNRIQAINPTAEEIAAAIKQALSQPAQHDVSFRNDYIGYSLDGMAHTRIAEWAEGLAGNA